MHKYVYMFYLRCVLYCVHFSLGYFTFTRLFANIQIRITRFMLTVGAISTFWLSCMWVWLRGCPMTLQRGYNPFDQSVGRTRKPKRHWALNSTAKHHNPFNNHGEGLLSVLKHLTFKNCVFNGNTQNRFPKQFKTFPPENHGKKAQTQCMMCRVASWCILRRLTISEDLIVCLCVGKYVFHHPEDRRDMENDDVLPSRKRSG